MKRTCEKMAAQLVGEAVKLLADLRRTPEQAPVLDEANLRLRDALETVRRIRANLEAAKAGGKVA